MRRAETCTLKC